MVTKRLLYLVLFYLACLSLVSSKAEAAFVNSTGVFDYADIPTPVVQVPTDIGEDPVPEELPADELEPVAAPMGEEENQDQTEGGDDEGEKKNRRRRKRVRVIEESLTCEQALVAENTDCLTKVPPGYEPGSCKFEIINVECEWECACVAIVTEPPRQTRPPIESSEESAEEVPPPNNADCNIDRDLTFKNQFIDIKGFIKRYTFCP